MKVIKPLLCILLLLTSLRLDAQDLAPRVAIIIDDIGYQKVDPQIIALPYAITYAVMPFSPHGAQMAIEAKQQGREVILHMPMEAVAQNHLLGAGALRSQMNKKQVQQALEQALADVPQAVGVNNHMGSHYTTLAEPMNWTMEVMAKRGLFFIDSKTTNRSAVGQATLRYQVKTATRDVFLDNDKSYAALDRQFKQLISIAQQQGTAIAIGHPYPETYRYLKQHLPKLKSYGIELVYASTLIGPYQEATSQVATTGENQKVAQPSNTASQVQTTKQAVASKAPKVSAQEAANPSELKAGSKTTQEPTAAPESKDEPLRWHPPYLPNLPGFEALPNNEPKALGSSVIGNFSPLGDLN